MIIDHTRTSTIAAHHILPSVCFYYTSKQGWFLKLCKYQKHKMSFFPTKNALFKRFLVFMENSASFRPDDKSEEFVALAQIAFIERFFSLFILAHFFPPLFRVCHVDIVVARARRRPRYLAQQRGD